MKHSPGKWEPEFVGHGGPGDNPVEFWEVTNGHARIAENMTEADARLIAAAPELLAALLDVIGLAERGAKAGNDPEMTDLWMRGQIANARAVIAKLEG